MAWLFAREAGRRWWLSWLTPSAFMLHCRGNWAIHCCLFSARGQRVCVCVRTCTHLYISALVHTCASAHLHTFMFMHVCLLIPVRVCIPMEVRGCWHCLPSSTDLHCIFWDRVSHQTWSFMTWPAWLTSQPQDSPAPISASPVLGLWVPSHALLFTCFTWMLGIWTEAFMLVCRAIYLAYCLC